MRALRRAVKTYDREKIWKKRLYVPEDQRDR